MSVVLWLLVSLCMVFAAVDREWSSRSKGILFALVIPAFTGLVLLRGVFTGTVVVLEYALSCAYCGWLVGSGLRPAAAIHEYVDTHAEYARWRIICARTGLILGLLLGAILGANVNPE